jgi:hypothetical protein
LEQTKAAESAAGILDDRREAKETETADFGRLYRWSGQRAAQEAG